MHFYQSRCFPNLLLDRTITMIYKMVRIRRPKFEYRATYKISNRLVKVGLEGKMCDNAL